MVNSKFVILVDDIDLPEEAKKSMVNALERTVRNEIATWDFAKNIKVRPMDKSLLSANGPILGLVVGD